MLKYHFDVTLAINTLLLSMEEKHYTITQLWGTDIGTACFITLCSRLHITVCNQTKKLYLPFDNKLDSICSEFQNKLFVFILQPVLTNSLK
jgi:hypothetical protein